MFLPGTPEIRGQNESLLPLMFMSGIQFTVTESPDRSGDKGLGEALSF